MGMGRSPDMNATQRHILILLACVLAFMLLYPPFCITTTERSYGLGYLFILDEPHDRRPRIDIAVHLLQLIVASCVGALAYLAAGQKSKPQTKAKLLEVFPEHLIDDAQKFNKRFPDFATLLREDSVEGERLRRFLEEYGPEHVLVEDYAARMAERR